MTTVGGLSEIEPDTAVSGRQSPANEAAAAPASVRIVGAGMTAVDCLAIIYLALPVAIFFFTWFRPLYGIPLGLAALSGIPFLFPLKFGPPNDRVLIVAGLVATGWTVLGGAGHFFFANYFDWHIRDAVLRDLVVMPAPVTYQVHAGITTILRAPVAYYLLPALLGRVTGLRNADWFLFLWTLTGVFLFLMQVMAGERRWKVLALIATVVVLYSGLDILMSPPWLLFDVATDRQMWAWPFFVYRSNSATLFWGPAHALTAWLTIATIYRCQDDKRFPPLAAWVGALTLLWSPLVSVGLLPFFLALAWKHFRSASWRSLLSPFNLVAAPALALAAGLFLTAAVDTIRPRIPNPYGWEHMAIIYGKFVLIEFFILALALLRAHRVGIQPLFFWVAVSVLLTLPLFYFGPNNELCLYGSIPALTVIMFSAVDGWARTIRIGSRGILVTAILAIGAVSPLSEMARSVLWPAWKPDLRRSLFEVTNGQSPNYFASLTEDMPLARLLRDPIPR